MLPRREGLVPDGYLRVLHVSRAGAGAADHQRRSRRRIRPPRGIIYGALLEPGRRSAIGLGVGYLSRGQSRDDAQAALRFWSLERRIPRGAPPASPTAETPRRTDHSDNGGAHGRRPGRVSTHGDESHAKGRADRRVREGVDRRVESRGGEDGGARARTEADHGHVLRGGEFRADTSIGERGVVRIAQGRARGFGRRRASDDGSASFQRRPGGEVANARGSKSRLPGAGRERRAGDTERGVRDARAVRAGLHEEPPVAD